MTHGIEGKPSELHPARVARDLGLDVRGGQLTWADVLDAAISAYWNNRPEPRPTSDVAA